MVDMNRIMAAATKQAARMAVAEALQTGELERKPCDECGKLATEAHHPDYALPLDVVWLCRKHHLALHRATENPRPPPYEAPAGSNFKSALADLGLTQLVLCDRLGINKSTVNRWVKGKLLVPQYVVAYLDAIKKLRAAQIPY